MNKQPTLIRTHSATMLQLAPGGGIPIDLPQRLIGELIMLQRNTALVERLTA